MGKVWETMKLDTQFAKTAAPIAVPLILKGNTSGSITQTTGPQVAAKEMMYVAVQTNVIIASGSVRSEGWGRKKWENPRTA